MAAGERHSVLRGPCVFVRGSHRPVRRARWASMKLYVSRSSGRPWAADGHFSEILPNIYVGCICGVWREKRESVSCVMRVLYYVLCTRYEVLCTVHRYICAHASKSIVKINPSTVYYCVVLIAIHPPYDYIHDVLRSTSMYEILCKMYYVRGTRYICTYMY